MSLLHPRLILLLWIAILGLIHSEPLPPLPGDSSSHPLDAANTPSPSTALATRPDGTVSHGLKQPRTRLPLFRGSAHFWFWNEIFRGRNGGQGVSWFTASEIEERGMDIPFRSREQYMMKGHIYFFLAHLPLDGPLVTTEAFTYPSYESIQRAMGDWKHVAFIYVRVDSKSFNVEGARRRHGLLNAIAYVYDAVPRGDWDTSPPKVEARQRQTWKPQHPGIAGNPDITYEFLRHAREWPRIEKDMNAATQIFLRDDPDWSDTYNCSTYAMYLASLPAPEPKKRKRPPKHDENDDNDGDGDDGDGDNHNHNGRR